MKTSIQNSRPSSFPKKLGEMYEMIPGFGTSLGAETILMCLEEEKTTDMYRVFKGVVLHTKNVENRKVGMIGDSFLSERFIPFVGSLTIESP